MDEHDQPDEDRHDKATVEEFANRVREAYEQIWGADGLNDEGDPFLLRGVIVGIEVEYLNGDETSYVGIRSMSRAAAIGIGTIMVQGWVQDATD